jgi:translation initiation factor 1A
MGIKSAKAKKRQDKKQDKKLQFANGARPMVRVREDQQDYGRITKVLGGCRFMVLLSITGRESIGWLCGSLHRRGWLMVDSVVLVSIRDFQNDKVDIIHKYTDDNVKQLLGLGEITPAFIQREDKWGREGAQNNDIFQVLEPETDAVADDGGDSEDSEDAEEGTRKWPMTLEDMLPPRYEDYDTEDDDDEKIDSVADADAVVAVEAEKEAIVDDVVTTVEKVGKVDKRHKKKGREKGLEKKEDMVDIDAL